MGGARASGSTRRDELGVDGLPDELLEYGRRTATSSAIRASTSASPEGDAEILALRDDVDGGCCQVR